MAWVVMAALIAIFAWFAHRNPANGNEWRNILWYDELIAGIFVLQIVFVWAARIVIAARTVKSDIVRAGYRYSFSDNGIRFGSSVKSSDFEWSAILAVRETRKAFVLRGNPKPFFLIPQRCFSSDADKSAFRTMLRANISEVHLRTV